MSSAEKIDAQATQASPQVEEDFCRKCSWNDSDYGCTQPSGEELWQCELYRHTHPEEVEEFERYLQASAEERARMEQEYKKHNESKDNSNDFCF